MNNFYNEKIKIFYFTKFYFDFTKNIITNFVKTRKFNSFFFLIETLNEKKMEQEIYSVKLGMTDGKVQGPAY